HCGVDASERPSARHPRMERNPRGRPGRRRRRFRGEAIRSGGPEKRSEEAGGGVKRSVSLRDRMLVASVTLAAIVIGVFVALILALSALHNANKQEARSKKVTASALTLDRRVLTLETALRRTYDRPSTTRTLRTFTEAAQW